MDCLVRFSRPVRGGNEGRGRWGGLLRIERIPLFVGTWSCQTPEVAPRDVIYF